MILNQITLLPPFHFIRLISKFSFFRFISFIFIAPHHMFKFEGALSYCMRGLKKNSSMHVIFCHLLVPHACIEINALVNPIFYGKRVH